MTTRRYSTAVEATTVRQFLRDLADENPLPVETWSQRDVFDPMHSLREIRAAARRGWIELDESSGDPETMRFRFTAAGRAAALSAQEDGQ